MEVRNALGVWTGLAAVCTVLCLLPDLARASKEHWEEFEKIAGAAQEISPHGNDMFGDRINLQNGALSFSVTDVSVPGNNALRVEFTRTFATKTRSRFNRGSPGSLANPLDAVMGDWEIDLPHVGGVFPRSTGWINPAAGLAAKRCSVGSPVQARSPNVTVGAQVFDGSEIWQGTRINLPGRGNSAMLVRTVPLPQPSGETAYWITSDWTSVSCLPSIANGAGEGFLATDSEGNKYRFDWLAVAAEQRLAKKNPHPTASPRYFFLDRGRHALYATRVEDRFGNWVNYSYSNAASAPVKLDRIESSDGRVLTLSYAGGKLNSVSAHGRTWTYNYNPEGSLTTVTLPDNSSWSIQLPNFQNLLLAYVLVSAGSEDPYRSCTDPGEMIEQSYVGTIKHPAGAVGTFQVHTQRFYKDGIDFATNCATFSPYTTNDDEPYFPMAWDSYAVGYKTISGPGIPTPATWFYNFSYGRHTEVRGPGDFAKYTYGNHFRLNEGKLLRVERGASASQILEVQDLEYELSQTGTPFPPTLGQSGHPKTPEWGEVYLRPQKQATRTRQGTAFRTVVNSFDAYARPVAKTRSSTASGLPSKLEVTEYHDNTAKWVLGQQKKLTVDNTFVAMEVEFDDVFALPVTYYAFRNVDASYKVEQSLTYNTTASVASGQRGTVSTVRDGAGKTTTAANWKRGIPQTVTYADSTSETGVVDDRGWLTSVRDENGFQTCYAHDPMGRIQLVTYPTQTSPYSCGTSDWLPTSSSFVPVAVAEFGIAAGHWRQVVTTGNSVKETYFDGQWRPLLTREFDAANVAETRRMVLRSFDSEGRKIFESYPQGSIESVTSTPFGTVTRYDALGRVIQTLADSELGWLTTDHAYLPGFRTAITNGRGFTTTTTYRAFDNPEEAHAVTIAAPEGVHLSIDRDRFDKPTQITRSGGGLSASRTYVYDAYQRLCKTIEPESGVTLVDYDGADNVIWRVVGTSLTALSCDRDSAPAGRKISHGYDLRNRLISTTYGDGSQSITRVYTPDGLLRQLVASDPNNPITWNYAYNSRRKLVREGYSWWPGVAVDTWDGWNFTYGFDAHGHVNSLSDPWGPLVYAPNALGQPTRVGDYVNNVRYHPNGSVKSYSLFNGTSHNTTLNVRGLPERIQYPGIADDAYSYDANGNITAISDLQQGINNRSMPLYDGLDRLRQANGPWGSGSFGYDALDNLVSSVVGGRTLTHYINPSSNLLTSLSGSQNIAIGYDANGNVTQRGSQNFGFDLGNRMKSAAGKFAGMVYDGHGRRSLVWFAAGGYMLPAYTTDGKLRFSLRTGEGHTRYVYLGDRLVAEYTEGTGSHVYSHTDALGSPIARTNESGTVVSRTRYEPYGATVAGSTNPVKLGYTGHVNDVETGLVYMQQRYYDPVAGRFLSVDPVTTDSDNGALFNRFMYAANSPYAFVDRDGRCTGSHITDSNGMCASTGGTTTGSSGALQGMQRGRVGPLELDWGDLGSPESNRQGQSNTPGDQLFIESVKALGSLGIQVAGFTPAGRSVKFAVALRARVHSHHPWPKYLGGPKKQELQRLPKSVHDAYHSGLDKILPRQRGTPYYSNLSPVARQQMQRDLADYTKAFDAKYGTQLYDSMIRNGFPAP